MARLGDVCTIVSGTTPKSSCPEYWDGDINWVTPAELNDESDVIYESQRKITKQAVMDSSLKAFPAGTVLLSSRAPIGKVAIAGTEMYCNQGFKNLICSDAIYNRYLYHFLKSKTEYLNSLGRGATFKEISKSIVEEIEIPLPQMEEQRRTAALLAKVSDLIAKRRASLYKLDLLVKARFVEMFGDPVRNNRGWDTDRLDDLCNGVGDGLHGTPEYDENGIYPFINGNNLIDGKIVITDATKKINEKEYKKLFIEISKNAILISINGTLGKLAFYNGESVALGKSACYCNLRDKISRRFIYGIMESDAFADFMEKASTKSTIKNVGLKAMREFKVIRPPLKLQNQYDAFVEHTDKSKMTIQQSLDKLETLKKALMQQYYG